MTKWTDGKSWAEFSTDCDPSSALLLPDEAMRLFYDFFPLEIESESHIACQLFLAFIFGGQIT